MDIKEATTDLVTEFPISLGPPDASKPTEHDTIEIVTAKNKDFIMPTEISEMVTT